MAKVNHLNYIPSSGNIYCERLRDIVSFDNVHVMQHCNECRFYNGSVQGEGVECLYEDPDAGDNSFIALRDDMDNLKLCDRRLKRFNEQDYGKK